MSEASAKATPPRPRRRPPNVAQTGQPQAANVNSVGQILRAAREKRGVTVEQIAEMLKIRRVYLQAIEDSNWEELPELVYAQGFVRSYAAFLNLDESGAAAQFKREFRGGRRTPELEMPQPLDDHQMPDIKVIISVVIALFVIFILWSAATAPPVTEKLPTVAETQTAEETTAAVETPATNPETQNPTADTATAAAPNTGVRRQRDARL